MYNSKKQIFINLREIYWGKKIQQKMKKKIERERERERNNLFYMGNICVECE